MFVCLCVFLATAIAEDYEQGLVFQVDLGKHGTHPIFVSLSVHSSVIHSEQGARVLSNATFSPA